jgi:methylmalonyl-CoA mutase N-terminal domain/subunit
MEQIESMGGFTACFKSQWIEQHLNNARYEYANKLESGEQMSVGVNIFREEDEEININIFRPSEDMQNKRIEYIHDFKRKRDRKKTEESLRHLYSETRQSPDSNCLPAIIRAVEDEATLGEISDTLRDAYDFKVDY